MKLYQAAASLLIMLSLMLASPSVLTAASLDMPASLKPSLGSTIVKADKAQADKLRSLYSELTRLHSEQQDGTAKLKALRADNEAALALLHKQIRQIDAAKIDKLEADAAKTRERHKPLLSRYTTLNKQIEAAKALKSKELNSALRLQASLLKLPVQLARADIKDKDTALKRAKDIAGETMKKARATLAGIEPLKSQLKARQSAIRTIEASAAPAWSLFKQAAKKGDARTAAETLSSTVSLLRQIRSEQLKTADLENKIKAIIAAARAQITQR